MKWFKLWGAQVGLFLPWTDYGWYYGSDAHAAEVLGWLMQAGGTSYTWAMADAAGVPVFPIMPKAKPGSTTPTWQLPGVYA